jgi:trans-2,3-dihydro-3-hydroxyanthranilate isomerase
MADYRFLILDVFTDRPLAGNQLAVFNDAHGIPEERLQPLAREVGFSETVFAYPEGPTDRVRIRIFTPRNELPFAGHPVLGSAVALAAPGQVDIGIETRRGTVPVRLERKGPRDYGWMVQPIPAFEPFSQADELLAALGVGHSELPVEIYDNGVEHVFVALASVDAVAGLQPDYGRLARSFPSIGINCFAGSGGSWKTRMFFPSDGIPEDPATGSAAGPLVVHLARHGRIAWGQRIEISQGAEIGRPSKLHARVDGSAGAVREVGVGGHAVLVARGEFDLE